MPKTKLAGIIFVFSGGFSGGKICMGLERWNVLAERMPVLKSLILGHEGMKSNIDVSDDGFQYTHIPETFGVQMTDFAKLCNCVLEREKVPQDENKRQLLLQTAIQFGGCEHLEELIIKLQQSENEAALAKEREEINNPMLPDDDRLQQFLWCSAATHMVYRYIEEGWMVTRHLLLEKKVMTFLRKRKASENVKLYVRVFQNIQ